MNLWAEIGRDGDGGWGKSVRGNGADPKTAAHHLSRTELNSGHEIQSAEKAPRGMGIDKGKKRTPCCSTLSYSLQNSLPANTLQIARWSRTRAHRLKKVSCFYSVLPAVNTVL